MRVFSDGLPGLAATDWTIVCDFDGTVTPFDVTDAVLNAFAPPEWETVEREWLAGRLTARECMERQVGMLHVSVSDLDAFLDGVPLTEGFTDFTALCQERGLALHIVSDGIDYAIQRILKRHGLENVPVTANKLSFAAGDGYRLSFPHSRANCPSGVCKCAVAESTGQKTLLVGDGHSDCCVASTTNFVLARQGMRLQAECEARAYPHRTFTDFHDVCEMVSLMSAAASISTSTDTSVTVSGTASANGFAGAPAGTSVTVSGRASGNAKSKTAAA